MATKSFDELIAGANTIKDNQLPESNTSSLVGDQLVQMSTKLKEENASRMLMTNEYNVSVLRPTGGVKADGTAGGPYYTLETATAILPEIIAQVGGQIKKSDKLSFQNISSFHNVDIYEYEGGNINPINFNLLNYDTYGADNSEFIKVITDETSKVLQGIRKNGAIYIPKLENPIIKSLEEKVDSSLKNIADNETRTPQDSSSSEFIDVKIDEQDRIIEGTKSDGTKYIPKLESPIIDEIKDNEALLTKKIDDIEASFPSTIRKRTKLVVNNALLKFPFIKPQQKDIYITLSGDSITAYQCVSQMDELGVAAVPPTCDKKANANEFWNAVKWGNVQYRRFDWGKKSLVGDWDSTWYDDNSAYFVENGVFKTEYIGSVMRNKSQFINALKPVQVSTKIDAASFPYQFDISENDWWQRNIPKRFSNAANASVKFIIPKGYSKFDFLYHAHIHGDNVTITTNRDNGAVKIGEKPNDWDNASEANGSVVDTNMSNFIETDGGNDTYGIPNMRMHFKINDTSVDTEITITKSSDTTKYLIYWGIEYWGTTQMPYGLHINNQAIGGYGQQNIWNLRSSMFKFTQPDAILLECCYNNLAANDISAYQQVLEVMNNLKTYFLNNIGLDITKSVGTWIPHSGTTSCKDFPDVAQINNQGTEHGLNELEYNVIANFKKVINDVNEVFYNKTPWDMMAYLGDVHLNYFGQQLYGAVWESLK